MSSENDDHARDPDQLANVALFDGMTRGERSRVVQLSDQIDISSGTVLVDQGDPGTFCFVILEGSAGVYVNGEYVSTSGPGTTVGEMALHDHHPRTATVIANTEMVLLRFDIPAFRSLLAEMPKASERINAILASRLR